jgi:oxalate decarboxylase/phosphoglucose isomerase-like protein (cupin superfamily)
MWVESKPAVTAFEFSNTVFSFTLQFDIINFLSMKAGPMSCFVVVSSLIFSAMAQVPDIVLFSMQEVALADTDFVFDLANSKPVATAMSGGTQHAATTENFRAIRIATNGGLTAGVQVLFKFKACEFRTPHFHPRGTENFHIIKGTIRANFLRENGSLVSNDVSAGFSGFFPVGHYHFVQNPTCVDAMSLQTFDKNDPGTVEVSALPNLPTDTLDLTLGINHITPDMALMRRAIQQSNECLKRCGISKTTSFADTKPETAF